MSKFLHDAANDDDTEDDDDRAMTLPRHFHVNSPANKVLI